MKNMKSIDRKIVYINVTAGGSHGGIAYDAARAASLAGFMPTLAFARGDAPAGMDSLRIGSRLDTNLAGLGSRLLDNHGFASRRATGHFLAQLDRMRPDLLHLHNLHGYYINVEMLFRYIKERGVKTIWTLHDCWALTGHCSHFVRANCGKWRDCCSRCPMRAEYPASLLLDRSFSNHSRKKAAFLSVRDMRIVTPSHWLAGIVGESFLRGYPASVIHSGVDLDFWKPDAPPITRKPNRVLAVAAPFDERKGLSDILKAAALLPELEFVLVGLTERQTRNLPGNVKGYARVTDPAILRRHYNEAALLVNATYEDTYPTVNMEAIACGLPVVSYDTGGCAEQVTDACGLLTREKSAQGLADGISRMMLKIAEDGGRGGMAEGCRRHAEENFDRKKAAAEYVKLYNEAFCEKA